MFFFRIFSGLGYESKQMDRKETRKRIVSCGRPVQNRVLCRSVHDVQPPGRGGDERIGRIDGAEDVRENKI